MPIINDMKTMNTQTLRRVEDHRSAPWHSGITEAASTEEREEIHRFWYRVYVEEMGKRFPYADHETKALRDPLTEFSTTFYIKDDEGIIGTFRLTPGDAVEIPPELREFYGLDLFDEFPTDSYSFSSRLIVDRRWRNGTLIGLLITESFQTLLRWGHRFNFGYCAPSLVLLYEQLGLRRYKENVNDPDTGLRVPMVLVVRDHDHFEAVRSPFSRLNRHLQKDSEAVEWFRRTFPPRIDMIPSRIIREDDLLRFIQERLSSVEIPLFDHLSDEEVAEFMKASTIITCRAGQTVLCRGQMGNEMFLILSGAVEVRYLKGGINHVLSTYGRGQIIGEMAFVSEIPRAADVVAATDLELLVLDQGFLKKLTIRVPKLASRILFNLAVILCDRLRSTTLGWVESIDFFRLPQREEKGCT